MVLDCFLFLGCFLGIIWDELKIDFVGMVEKYATILQ